MNLYPDLPSELRTQTTANAPSQQLQQQQQQQQQGSQTSTATTTTTTTTNNSSLAPARGTTDNLGPVQRAARSIQETLEAEKRYPQLDDIVSREFRPVTPASGRRLLTCGVCLCGDQRVSHKTMSWPRRMPGSLSSALIATRYQMSSLNSTTASQVTR